MRRQGPSRWRTFNREGPLSEWKTERGGPQTEGPMEKQGVENDQRAQQRLVLQEIKTAGKRSKGVQEGAR